MRFAAELGYEVMVVKDATAALATNLPNYANGTATTKEVVDLLSGSKTLGMIAQ